MESNVMKENIYIPNIKSKEEFLFRFNKFFDFLNKKSDKIEAEKKFLDRFIDVRNNIMDIWVENLLLKEKNGL